MELKTYYEIIQIARNAKKIFDIESKRITTEDTETLCKFAVDIIERCKDEIKQAAFDYSTVVVELFTDIPVGDLVWVDEETGTRVENDKLKRIINNIIFANEEEKSLIKMSYDVLFNKRFYKLDELYKKCT